MPVFVVLDVAGEGLKTLGETFGVGQVANRLAIKYQIKDKA